MKFFITGDSRGLGNSLCNNFAKDYEVVGISRKDIDDCVWNHISCDLSQKTVSKEIEEELKNTDVLIHNAAIASSNLSLVETLSHGEKVFDVNFFTPFILTKTWLKYRIGKKKPGQVIFISSICSKKTFKGLGMYAASKAAINSFSKTIATEMGSRGIRSNVVLPGYMETDMSASLTDNQLEKIRSRSPMKRLATLDEVVKAVQFLATESTYNNGSEIVIDGGYIL